MNSFYSAFLNIHRSGVLTALAWLVPQESAARESQSRHVLCTPYNHAPCHFMQSHIRKVYACLAVTCHLRFWQDDRGLLRATAVTLGWNGYRIVGASKKKKSLTNNTHPLAKGPAPSGRQQTCSFRLWVPQKKRSLTNNTHPLAKGPAPSGRQQTCSFRLGMQHKKRISDQQHSPANYGAGAFRTAADPVP